MNLLLHIGTEKTGSSYLQSLLAWNREQLVAASIHFPKAGRRESALLKGQISAGNGENLNACLTQRDWTGVKHILHQHYEAARREGSQQVLLSNEMLLSAFATSEVLARLLRLAREVGYRNVRLLLVLRDPVDQALSLYKHRAKSGEIAEIEDWVQAHYYYGDWLQAFLSHSEEHDVELRVRGYARTPGYLEQLLFVDWLGVSLPERVGKSVVNPSLSVSELLFIKQLREERPALIQEFYTRMLTIPATDKADDYRLESYYRQVLGNYLAQYEILWHQCNGLLPEEEQLRMPQAGDGAATEAPREKAIVFSPIQSKALVALLSESLEPNLRWRLRRRSARQHLAHLKTKMLKVVNL